MIALSRPSPLVGVILPSPADAFAGSLAAELQKAALPRGITLLFGYSLGDPVLFERLARRFSTLKADALAAVPHPDIDPDLLELPFIAITAAPTPALTAADCLARLLTVIDKI